MAKSRVCKGGLRPGVGRPYKWPNSGATKSIRVPVAYVVQVLEVVDYLDAVGELPGSLSLFLASDFPSSKYDFSVELPYPLNPTDIK